MTTPGPWRDDSLDVTMWTAAMSTGDIDSGDQGGIVHRSLKVGGSVDFPAAWAGGGTLSTVATTTKNSNEQAAIGYGYPLATSSGQYETNWQTAWFTISRPDTPIVTEGLLPDTVVDGSGNFLDPSVVGVEWEPTDTPISHTLDGQVKLWGELPFDTAAMKVLQADGAYVTSAVDPGFLSAASVAALDTLATFPKLGVVKPFNIAAPAGLPVSGAATLTVGMIDSLSATQTVPATPPYTQTSWAEIQSLHISSVYRPRYRLLYRGTPPLRQWPRTDGLATSSARRLWPPSRSIQGSNRQRGPGGYL